MASFLQPTKSSNVTNAQSLSNSMNSVIKRFTAMKRLSGSVGNADDYGALIA